jgi:hypothetical protein
LARVVVVLVEGQVLVVLRVVLVEIQLLALTLRTVVLVVQ